MSISEQAQLMVNYILSKIINQEWKQDKQIPSEGFFQIKFNISNAVVRKALNKLQQINLIYAKERIGYFVQKNNLQLIFKRETYSDGCNGYDYLFDDFSAYYNLKELKAIPFANTNIKSIVFPDKTYMFYKSYFDDSSSKKTIRKISYSINSQRFLPKKHFHVRKPLFWNMLLADGLPSKRYSFSKYETIVPKQVRQILNLSNSIGAIVKYVILVSPNNEIIHSAKIWINPRYFSSERVSHL